MNLIYFLLLLFIAAWPLGNLGRFSLAFLGLENVNVYLNDFLLPLLIFVFLTQVFVVKKKFFLPPLSGMLLLFIGAAFLSLLNAQRWLEGKEFLISLLYLVRWVEYAFLYPITFYLARFFFSRNKGRQELLFHFLLGAIFIFALLGIMQFVFFPDFSRYVAHGWDPHYYRLLSTFFDPNFAGIFLLLGFNLVLARLLQEGANFSRSQKLIYPLLAFVFFLAIVLTFSRSSYLAFLTAIFFLGLFKSRQLLFFFLFLALLAYLTIPKVRLRVEGAVHLDVTARARIADWRKTAVIIRDHPFLGVGFNAFRYAQIRYGYFRNQRGLEIPSGHAGAGADSSFLFVAATTGLGGFLLYFLFWWRCWWQSFRNYWRQRTLPSTATNSALQLALIISIPALMIQSQFVNSLFFPWIMAWNWILIALAHADSV